MEQKWLYRVNRKLGRVEKLPVDKETKTRWKILPGHVKGDYIAKPKKKSKEKYYTTEEEALKALYPALMERAEVLSRRLLNLKLKADAIAENQQEHIQRHIMFAPKPVLEKARRRKAIILEEIFGEESET